MSNDVPEGVGPGPARRPRAGDGGAPVSGALAIVLAVVAVVAGFLILRAISDDDNGSAASPGNGDDTTDTTVASSAVVTTVPATTTTTTPPLVTEGAVVVVANASNVNGSAGAMSDDLAAVGFEMGTATNVSGAMGQQETSSIYYRAENAAAQAVAESVNRSIGGDASIAPLQTPAPTENGELDGDVLLLLGIDKAGKSLEELAPTAATGSETTTVSAPPVGGTTETTAAG